MSLPFAFFDFWRSRSLRCILGLSVYFVGSSLAIETSAEDFSQMANMSLRELLELRVSVGNRASESVKQSPAAITVITAREIQQSGIRTIPEIMRLVPGIHVSRIDGNKWAINSRRLATRFANSMLVLKNGRTLYNPLFAGTFWDAQDTNIDDIERIEVIRGPGSTSWGANAISGVINIVTKSSKDTQGALAFLGAGKGEIESEAGIRFGGDVKAGHFRVYAKTRRTDDGRYLVDSLSNNSLFLNEPDADDGVESTMAGLRVDLAIGDSVHMAEAEYYDGESHDIRLPSGLMNSVETNNYHALYRYEHPLSEMTRVEASVYFDHTEQSSNSFGDKRDIIDIEAIAHQQWWQHKVSLGLSYRRLRDDTSQRVFGLAGFALEPSSRTDEVVGMFVQDSWEIAPERLTVLAGVRLEHNDYSGFEYNPSLRTTYNIGERELVWGALTRSVRTPSRIESDAYLDFSDFNAFCPLTFDPDLGCIQPIASVSDDSEVTYSYELGYRNLVFSSLSVDLAAFYEREVDPLADTSGGRVRRTEFHGAELEVSYQMSNWQLSSNLAYFEIEPDRDSNIESSKVENWQYGLKSYYQFSHMLAWNLMLSYGDSQYSFPAYTRLDTNFVWSPTTRFELQLIFNNLLDEFHYEGQDPTRMNSAIRRGGELLLSYSF